MTTLHAPQVSVSDWETSQQIQQIERRRNLGGRPKKLPEQRAVVKFYPSYTHTQWQRLRDRAESAGLSEVELIRRLSLELPLGRTLPAPSREALTLLSNATSNLNQIARRLNSDIETKPTEIMNAIRETHTAIAIVGTSLHDK